MQWYQWILIVLGYLFLGLIHLGVRRILIENYYMNNWKDSNDACGDGENFCTWIGWPISFICIFVTLFIELLIGIFDWFARGFGKYGDLKKKEK